MIYVVILYILFFFRFVCKNEYFDCSCCMYKIVMMMMISRNLLFDDRLIISGRLLFLEDIRFWLFVIMK